MKTNSGIIPIISALLASLMGIVVLLGWIIHAERLIQLAPQFAPMQFNTALCFLLCGIGLFALTQGRQWICLAAGGSAGIIAILTLTEYALDVTFPIDQLFMKAYITANTSHPGRMAPNTALCFLFTSIFLSNWRRLKAGASAGLIDEAIGFIILALATVPMIGYLINVETAYGWGDLTRMAPHTAAGFIILSIGVIVYSWRIKSTAEVFNSLWAPSVIALLVLLLDLYSPLGAAVGVAYIPLVICGMWLSRPYAPFVLAGFSTILICLGFFASSESGIDVVVVLLNRALSILAVWASAGLVFLHRRSQTKAMDMQQRLLLATEAGEVGIWEWDLDTEKLVWDDRMFKLYDLDRPKGAFKYEHWSHVLHPDDIAETEEKISKALADEEAYHPKFRIITKDKNIRYLEARATVMRNNEGTPLKMFGVCWDTTKQREAAERLEKLVDELTASNSELERFSYIASHDLKEPLRMVMNFSQLLSERYGDKLDETAKEYIRFSVDAAKRMHQLVEDLLEYARLGDEAVRFSNVNLESLLDVVKQNLHDSIHENSASVTNDPLPVVFGNPVRLTSLLQNLVGNAIKYHSPGVSPSIHIGVTNHGGDLCFSITDNGIGIKQDYADKIFLPFKRLHGKNEFSGTGIGLAVCKKIIENHGGRIWVESDGPGQGCSFKFILPAQTEGEKDAQEHSETTRAAS